MHEDAERNVPPAKHPGWRGYAALITRRRLIIAVSLLASTYLLFLFSQYTWASTHEHQIISAMSETPLSPSPTQSQGQSLQNATNTTNALEAMPVDPFGPEANLLGQPTLHFRDNLRPDKKYITTWLSAGWTNDVMSYINLIYLGLLTEHIPVIPMFVPSHLGTIPPIDFGQVFDLPRLRKLLNTTLLEWHEVKDRHSNALDEMGCWNVWEGVGNAGARGSPIPYMLNLDVSYTKAPSWIKVIPKYEADVHSYFWALAALAFPEMRAESLVPPRESEKNHVLLPPDEQMLCYDFLYFVCANQPFEMEYDYSPAWRFVGQHLHWAPSLHQLTIEYVRRTIGVAKDQQTPYWIAIHVRRGDFGNVCSGDKSECFASLQVIARRVEEVKVELKERKGISVEHVIMTSDERDPAWWEEVKARGWLAVDHSHTATALGPWYPVLIDAAIQSLGIGFVGTDKSTMSTIARRRVESWHGGVTRIFKWGTPDADNH